jgi:hypothetical protein
MKLRNFAFALALGISATAGAAESGHPQIDIVDFGTYTRATLNDVLRAGDCRMGKGSYIDFFPNGKGEFHSTVWTMQTSSGDVWHQTSKVLLNDPGHNHMWLQWDSPTLWVTPPPNPYPAVRFNAGFDFNLAAYPLLWKVEWWGKC